MKINDLERNVVYKESDPYSEMISRPRIVVIDNKSPSTFDTLVYTQLPNKVVAISILNNESEEELNAPRTIYKDLKKSDKDIAYKRKIIKDSFKDTTTLQTRKGPVAKLA